MITNRGWGCTFDYMFCFLIMWQWRKDIIKIARWQTFFVINYQSYTLLFNIFLYWLSLIAMLWHIYWHIFWFLSFTALNPCLNTSLCTDTGEYCEPDSSQAGYTCRCQAYNGFLRVSNQCLSEYILQGFPISGGFVAAPTPYSPPLRHETKENKNW